MKDYQEQKVVNEVPQYGPCSSTETSTPKASIRKRREESARASGRLIPSTGGTGTLRTWCATERSCG